MDFARVFEARKKRRFSRFTSKIKWFRFLVVGGLVAAVLGIISIIAVFAWFSRDLPSPERIVRKSGFSTKIMARDGEVLYDVYGDVQRELVNLSLVPDSLKQATVAVEDKNFYSHQGFDVTGMGRAVFNIIIRHRLEGGSTLTQQLVKNVLLTQERSLPRKLKEFVLAVQLEKRFSKDQILQMYLQESPYGGQAVGVGTAASVYFGKQVEELVLTESAFLAGLPQAPTRYSPYGKNPEAYIARTEHVLRRMKDDGYITAEQEKTSVEELKDLKFKPPGTTIKAPHFVMYVKDILASQFGEDMVEGGGLKVTTTLDLKLQEKAESIVSEEIEKVKALNISNGAVMAMNPTNGEILSMVGSRDFHSTEIDGQVNVTIRPRQPGSAIKPVTYLTALRKGFPPSFMIVDNKTSFDSGDPEKPYEPENYDGKFRGPVQLRYALGSSLNVPSVKLLQLAGLKDMLSVAFDLGLTTLEPTAANLRRLGLSVTLGGGEVKLLDLVSAYSAFANGGDKIAPVSILKVADSDGKILFQYHQVKSRRVISPQEAFLINNILTDNTARLLTFGVNSLLNMGSRPVAVKTGTTNDRKDNWAIGWSRSVIVGAWVGNNDNASMKEVASGASGASPIWRRLMLEALTVYPSENFETPPGIVSRDVDIISGYTTHDGFPSRPEYFMEQSIPDGQDPIHVKIPVCKSDGKKAGPVEIAKGDTEEREFILLEAPKELLEADRKKWQEGIDAWIAGQGDNRYKPPTEQCSSGEEAVIKVKQPQDQTKINNNSFDWEVEVVTGKKIDKVEVFVDGQSRQTLTSSPWKSTLNLPNGSYKLKFKATLEGAKEFESGEIKIGVNQEWNQSPTLTPTLTPTPTP
ncbi:transglycosylase domain-containing protein [Candidatus Collierbacteria bacterium]|nr:transglycosylase domain-containing protein [Candidatus Collierbacteria bacterium]